MKTKWKQHPWLLWATYICLILMLVTSVTLARYTTIVTGNGIATVAAVDVNISEFTFGNVKLSPGATETLTFNVTNFTGGEINDVNLDYTVTVSGTGNLPLTFALTGTASGTTGHIGSAATTVNGNVWSGGTFEHTYQTTHTYTLTVTWTQNAGDDAAAYADEIDAITVTVNAVQSAG